MIEMPATTVQTLTVLPQLTMLRLLLVSLARHGAIPKAEAHQIVSMTLRFVRDMQAAPELQPVAEAMIEQFESMLEDHADG